METDWGVHDDGWPDRTIRRYGRSGKTRRGTGSREGCKGAGIKGPSNPSLFDSTDDGARDFNFPRAGSRRVRAREDMNAMGASVVSSGYPGAGRRSPGASGGYIRQYPAPNRFLRVAAEGSKEVSLRRRLWDVVAELAGATEAATNASAAGRI